MVFYCITLRRTDSVGPVSDCGKYNTHRQHSSASNFTLTSWRHQ